VPGVDAAILNPRDTWADKSDYDATAAKLVRLFADNFAKFADHVDAGVLTAAPQAGQAQQQIREPVISAA
jgi:phosphoenolpyruvate carboxykinase (ATP)